MARPGVTRARAALLLGASVLTPVVALALNARAQQIHPSAPPRHGTVVLFILDASSFEDVMSVPTFRDVARAGGAALMTTKVGSGDRQRASYVTLGAGAKFPGAGTPFLMATVLRANGVQVCLPTELAAGPADAPPLLAPEATECSGETLNDHLVLATVPRPLGFGEIPGRREVSSEAVRLQRLLRQLPSGRTLVIVAAPLPSSEMDRRGDEVTPVLMAVGLHGVPAATPGSLHALRSDTTRHAGLVSNVDVAPTVLHFFGIPIPSEMDGSPIETTDDRAPFALHRLHLEQRRIRLPIQLGEVAFVSGLGIVGITALFVLARRGSLPRRFAIAMRFATLCGVAFPVALLAGGLLPRLTYAWAVPFLVITTVLLALLSLTARERGRLGPFTFLGAVALGFVVLDGVLGGQAFRVPLLGGTMFDGVRFYGLPNSFIALPLAGALILAVGLDPFRGFLLLVGVGLFCGFPSLGANVGASITLFTAAGLWWVVRTRPRLGLREVAFVAGVVALGLAAVLLANRLAPGTPTHAERFVERSGSSWHTALVSLWHRLGIGLGQIRHVPAAVIPLVGLVVVLILAIRPIGPVREGLRAVDERWPGMIAVLCAASMVAYLANDTGVAAAAPGFLYAITALVYPAYLLAPVQRQGRRRVGREAPAGAERSEHPRGPAVNSRRRGDGSTGDGPA